MWSEGLPSELESENQVVLTNIQYGTSWDENVVPSSPGHRFARLHWPSSTSFPWSPDSYIPLLTSGSLLNPPVGPFFPQWDMVNVAAFHPCEQARRLIVWMVLFSTVDEQTELLNRMKANSLWIQIVKQCLSFLMNMKYNTFNMLVSHIVKGCHVHVIPASSQSNSDSYFTFSKLQFIDHSHVKQPKTRSAKSLIDVIIQPSYRIDFF